MFTTAVTQRSRLALLLLLSFVGFGLSSHIPALVPVAYAQEGGENADAPKKAEKKKHSSVELFVHVVTSVGWVFGIILLLVSIALVTLVVLLLMELRMGAAIPPGFVEDFTETVNKRQFKAAFEMAKEDPSYLARVLTTGMGRLQYGIEDAREAAFNMVDSLKAGKENLINYLATIGTLGPLLGLVGTVFGMILSFMTLAKSTSVNAQDLAGDISHALAVTMVGIGLSVPAIFFHTFFRNRLTRLAHDIGNVADDLLTQMYHNSKKTGTTSTADIDAPSPAAAGAGAAGRPGAVKTSK
jgi:biopolymer transport protein ExbB